MTKVNQDAANQTQPPLIANMYERWTLDYIIELVHLIAIDFVNRPRQYRKVPPWITGVGNTGQSAHQLWNGGEPGPEPYLR